MSAPAMTGATAEAVHAFGRLLRAEKAVDERRKDLLRAIKRLSPDEVAVYFAATEEGE